MGANGAGKTNLLESLHVGTQGFSPRTRSDAELIRFGESAARIRLEGRRGQTAVRIGVALSTAEGKRAELNGARLRAAEQLRRETATLVFTPDRLAIVKAGPAARRAYFDRSLGRLLPARVELAGRLRGRSGAAERRAEAAATGRRSLPGPRSWPTSARPWCETRVELLELLAGPFAESRRRARAARTPGSRTRATADAEASSRRGSERDLERGSTGAGPHLARRLDRRPPTATCARSAPRGSSGRPCSRCCWPRRRC